MMSPGVGLFSRVAVLRHEGDGVVDGDRLAGRHLQQLHAALEAAGAHPHKGDAVAVLRIHVGLDLEDEAGELVFERRDFARLRDARQRLRRQPHQRVQQRLYAEVVDGRAEVHRALLAGQEEVLVEGVRGAAHQFDIDAQLFGLRAQHAVQLRVVQALDHAGRCALLRIGLRVEQLHRVVDEVVDALERLAHADRPRHRRALDLQHVFDFIEQLDGRAALAVELVDEGQDGRAAQAADVEQLDGLRFHAVDRVDHHDGGVDRRERAVGVFGEVFVARRVEQVDDVVATVVAVRKLHHRRGHRDAALLLQLHPVGGGVAAGLACAHSAGHLDRAAEPQQLFRERGLARVRVGNDGERPAAPDLLQQRTHGQKPKGRNRKGGKRTWRALGTRPAGVPRRPMDARAMRAAEIVRHWHPCPGSTSPAGKSGKLPGNRPRRKQDQYVVGIVRHRFRKRRYRSCHTAPVSWRPLRNRLLSRVGR